MTFLETRQSRATIVVVLRDDLQPDKMAVGDLFLKTPGMKRMPLRHRSGCFHLRDVQEGKYRVTAGGAHYPELNFEINTKTVDRARPFVEASLKPGPRYPFPQGMTVLKGKIIDDEDRRPLANTVVRISGRAECAVTDAQGEYVIIFPAAKSDLSITVQARAAGNRTTSSSIVLTGGKTRFVPLRLTKS